MIYLIENNHKLMDSRKGKLQVIEGRKAMCPRKYYRGLTGYRR